MSKDGVRETILRLLAGRAAVTSTEVAAAAGVTRQTAYHRLVEMAEQGILLHEGARRSSRYRLRADRLAHYSLEGLTEHVVWGSERIALRELDPDFEDTPNLLQVLTFSFTEMVNNAIEHSKGSMLDVAWFVGSDRLSFEVQDDGIGAFTSLRISRNLQSDFEAVGELSKGKQTTDPERHSGLGIFLTSRMVDRFVLSAGSLVWTVDNAIGDTALRWLDRSRIGTLVRCEISRTTTATQVNVMAQVQDPTTRKLNRTTINVELFRQGDFVSRTEAKLIGARLEGFEVIELDFSGVDQIGQGFADELFRVWAAEHPTSQLIPTNTSPAVAATIAAVER